MPLLDGRTDGARRALSVRPLAGGVDRHRRLRRGTARGPEKNRQLFSGPDPPRGGPRLKGFFLVPWALAIPKQTNKQTAEAHLMVSLLGIRV